MHNVNNIPTVHTVQRVEIRESTPIAIGIVLHCLGDTNPPNCVYGLPSNTISDLHDSLSEWLASNPEDRGLE